MNWTGWVLPKVPERPPTWREVVASVSIVVLLVIVSQEMSVESSSWAGLAFGILTTWLVAGPLATSSIGRRIDAWGEESGLGTSIGVLLCLVLTVLAVFTWLIPSQMESGLVVGFLLGTLGWFLVHVVSAGEVSGW